MILEDDFCVKISVDYCQNSKKHFLYVDVHRSGTVIYGGLLQ